MNCGDFNQQMREHNFFYVMKLRISTTMNVIFLILFVLYILLIMFIYFHINFSIANLNHNLTPKNNKVFMFGNPVINNEI